MGSGVSPVARGIVWLIRLVSLYDLNTLINSPAASQIMGSSCLHCTVASATDPDMMHRPLFRAMHQIGPGSDVSMVTATKSRESMAIFEESSTMEQVRGGDGRGSEDETSCTILADAKLIDTGLTTAGRTSIC